MMVRQAESEQAKSRQKVAAEKMTAVQRLHRALQSGPIKSELRTVQEAIHAAWALSTQAKNEMAGIRGLNHDKDFMAHIAYLTPDLSMLLTRRFKHGEEEDIHRELSGKCCIMAGLVFGMRDPERDNKWLIGGRPFLNTPLVRMALQQRIESDIIGVH